jgi:hypothetical protein
LLIVKELENLLHGTEQKRKYDQYKMAANKKYNGQRHGMRPNLMIGRIFDPTFFSPRTTVKTLEMNSGEQVTFKK